jgi:hypothetical protein
MIWLIHIGGDRPVHLFVFDSGQSGRSWGRYDVLDWESDLRRYPRFKLTISDTCSSSPSGLV